MFKPQVFIYLRSNAYLFVDPISLYMCYLCFTFVLLYCRVSSLQAFVSLVWRNRLNISLAHVVFSFWNHCFNLYYSVFQYPILKELKMSLTNAILTFV